MIPTWSLRPWVIQQEGREDHLGHPLSCVKCDQQAPRDRRPLGYQRTRPIPRQYTYPRPAFRPPVEAKRGTVSCAESCTGGLIAAAITEIAGSSAWFEQSWVTYSNAAKHQQLRRQQPHSDERRQPSHRRSHGAGRPARQQRLCHGHQRYRRPRGRHCGQTRRYRMDSPPGDQQPMFHSLATDPRRAPQAVDAAIAQLIALLKGALPFFNRKITV